MRGLQLFLFSAIICVSVKYSFAIQEFFGECSVTDDCPDYATCEVVGVDKKCKCQTGYYAIDLPVLSNGQAVTVCRSKYYYYKFTLVGLQLQVQDTSCNIEKSNFHLKNLFIFMFLFSSIYTGIVKKYVY